MKQSNSVHNAMRWIALIVAASFVAACASERDAINRVQPNYLDKSQLVGEWYYQRTVVDVPAQNGFTHVGDSAEMVRVAWDLQENTLFARRTTPVIKNGDGKDEPDGKFEGEVVAAFRVLSHFDIAHEYNPTTGETLNIVSENTRDRPWYERQFVRVDWSENLVTNYGLSFESTSIESVPYFVQSKEGEPLHPDAPHIEEDGSYFDVTSRIFAKAARISIPGWGEFPLCWFRGQETTDCGPGEYSIRHSFLKVDPSRQYEMMPYKGKETEVFGFFWSDRLVYNPVTGLREQGRERYMKRHNIWKAWRDSEGNLIPESQRELRPIVYHVNATFPEDLKPVARKVAAQFNDAFTKVVQAVGNQSTRPAFILCENNPVLASDPDECGPEGTAPRIGDVRYSFMAYIGDYMKYGLLGYGPSNHDPETGEIISGMAYVFHHNNIAANSTVEMLELLNGDRDPTTYIDGVDLTNWVNQVKSGQGNKNLFGLADAANMVKTVAHGKRSKFWEGQRIQISAADVAEQKLKGFAKWSKPARERIYSLGFLNGESHSAAGKLAHLKGSYIEDLLLDKEVLLAGGHSGDPTLPVTDEHRKAASVAHGGLGQLLKKRGILWERYAAERNMYTAEMADDALIGLARQLKGVKTEDARKLVRETIYSAVLAHEVGHSVGLMHNFGGSDDVINYFDNYWKIRDDGNVGPRLSDPITEQEKDAKIYNFAYSSIMDYAGRYTIDGQGLGKYDHAALMFGYAQKIEVFKDNAGMPHDDLNGWFTGSGEVLRFLQTGPRAVHYTTFYNTMGPKLYEDSNRMLVDVKNFTEDFATATVDGKTYTRVPYIYCTHTRSNLGDSCLTRDYGADSMERMKNMLDELDTWYIQRSFPRGQIGATDFGYVGRYYRRVYDRLKNWNDSYAYINDLMAQFYQPSVIESFLSDPINGWGDKTWAVQNAFNHLVQTIFTPDIGPYGGPVPQADGTQLLQKFYGSSQIGVTDGRYYSTSWSDGTRECGLMWWECLHHIGFYLDKIMAIEALSDSTTNFVARSSPEDLREWEIGYYNTFPEQIGRINAAIMSQDFSTVGPYMENGEVRFPNYTSEMTQSHSSLIDPYATFSIQLYWQVLGQARFFTNFDQTFVDDSRVFEVGTGSAPDLPASKIYTFQEPETGLVYGAIRFDDHVGGGQRVLQRANAMRARSTMCDNSAETTTTDDDCMNSVVSADRATAEMKKHVQLVKVLRDLAPILKHGSPFNP